MEHSQLQELHARVQGLEEREADRSKRPAEASPEATPPSQWRSSVASTELLQPEHVLTAPASYPVDAITESQNCHLMTQWMNLKVKAAVGSVYPTEPGATFFHRAASARACLDGSCQLSRGCYHGVSKLPPYDAMDEFEGQGGCWLCLSY